VLFLSPYTVETHRTNLMQKLGCTIRPPSCSMRCARG